MSNYTLDRKNKQVDFEALELEQGLSITRRPDAVSFDYLTAFGLGPRRVQDVSAGMVERPWRVRAVGNDIYLARTSDDGTSWVDEQLLFSIEGEPPIEIDLAFDQQGRAIVCVERETGTDGEKHIWLYWYDPVQTDFVFTDFGPGWTPRLIIDDPIDTTASDVQLFYFRQGFGLARREQRDRYLVEYSTPISEWENLFLEDVGFIKWYRFAVLYSKRNAGNGQYEIKRIESQLFPYRSFVGHRVGLALTSGSLDTIVIEYVSPADSHEVGLSITAGVLAELLITYEHLEGESTEVDLTIEGGSLQDMLIEYNNTKEPHAVGLTIESGQLHFYLIEHDQSDNPESHEVQITIQSGSLTIP